MAVSDSSCFLMIFPFPVAVSLPFLQYCCPQAAFRSKGFVLLFSLIFSSLCQKPSGYPVVLKIHWQVSQSTLYYGYHNLHDKTASFFFYGIKVNGKQLSIVNPPASPSESSAKLPHLSQLQYNACLSRCGKIGIQNVIMLILKFLQRGLYSGINACLFPTQKSHDSCRTPPELPEFLYPLTSPQSESLYSSHTHRQFSLWSDILGREHSRKCNQHALFYSREFPSRLRPASRLWKVRIHNAPISGNTLYSSK